MNRTVKKIFFRSTAVVLVSFTLLSVAVRLSRACVENTQAISTMAAGLVFSEGRISEPKQRSESTNLDTISTDTTSEKIIDAESAVNNERKFDIIESKYTAAGTGYDNFYVKNTASANINIGELLNAKLEFSAKDTSDPQVLIVHTHTTEAYMDTDAGFYYESYTARSDDDNKNVVSVGEAIANQLLLMGINVIHDKTHHDAPGYNGSYDRSMETIEKHLEENPSICVVLDIHRDALIANDEAIIKPTFTVNGRKAAQIMIMSGCDSEGVNGFSFWEENLKFALKLQKKAETLYPGMTRPLYFGDFTYNMNANTGSLLIEVGTHANSLDEAVYTGKLLGNVLAQVLKEA